MTRPGGKAPRGEASGGGASGSGARRRAGGRPPARRTGGEDAVVLYGFHPVVEALRNPRRRVRRLLATANAAARLAELDPPLAVEPVLVRPEEINRLVEADAVHQGFYLEADPLPGLALDELPADALVLALDQLTDPHNVGAILRTAAAFGVQAVLTTARHSPSATGVLAKAASGGLEHVPVVTVRNLADALIELGRQGFRRVGLDSEGAVTLESVGAGRPAVLVLGAEGKGLRRRTRACCDVVARIDLPGAIASLNVSNAAAIALHALSRREPRGGG